MRSRATGYALAGALAAAWVLAPARGAPALAAQAGQVPPPAREQVVPEVPAVPDSYVYDPAGRRDPFLSLTTAGAQDLRSPGARPEGLAGLLVNEAAVRGIVRSEGIYLAMIQGPDSRTYVIREGDRLFDGAVKEITAEAVVFVQEVSDPLSLEQEREVRRTLRSPEGGA